MKAARLLISARPQLTTKLTEQSLQWAPLTDMQTLETSSEKSLSTQTANSSISPGGGENLTARVPDLYYLQCPVLCKSYETCEETKKCGLYTGKKEQATETVHDEAQMENINK